MWAGLPVLEEAGGGVAADGDVLVYDFALPPLVVARDDLGH